MLIVLLICLIGVGCKQTGQDLPAKKAISEKMPTTGAQMKVEQAKFSRTGTIQFIAIEGGFYGIITEKGEKLLPMNLDPQYLINGTIISFEGTYIKDLVTIQQWGRPFRISKVQVIKKGTAIKPSEI